MALTKGYINGSRYTRLSVEGNFSTRFQSNMQLKSLLVIAEEDLETLCLSVKILKPFLNPLSMLILREERKHLTYLVNAKAFY